MLLSIDIQIKNGETIETPSLFKNVLFAFVNRRSPCLSHQSNPLNFKAEEVCQRRLDRLPSINFPGLGISKIQLMRSKKRTLLF